MEFGYDAILKIHPPKPLILGEWLYRMGFSCIKINTAVELHYAPPLVDRVWDLLRGSRLKICRADLLGRWYPQCWGPSSPFITHAEGGAFNNYLKYQGQKEFQKAADALERLQSILKDLSDRSKNMQEKK